MHSLKIIISLSALALAALACSLTDSGAAVVADGHTPTTPTPTVTLTGTPTTPTPECTVTSGLADGHVNLRACGGTDCAVVGTLAEGVLLTVLQPGAWAQVRTGEGLTGYVNSKFCEVSE